MKTYKENMIEWDKIIESFTHPLYKSVLINFHGDMTQEIVYLIENGNVQKDFNSIMNYVLEYILNHLYVQIKESKEFELLELVMQDEINEKVDKLFIKDEIDVYYIIEDFLPEEEFRLQREKDGYNEDDAVSSSMTINTNFTEKQLAMMELTNVKYKFGRLVEQYLNVYGLYINGEHFEEFED